MNNTIISIEGQDNGGKEATIIVIGERENQILFEENWYTGEYRLQVHRLP